MEKQSILILTIILCIVAGCDSSYNYGGYNTPSYYNRTPWNVWPAPTAGLNDFDYLPDYLPEEITEEQILFLQERQQPMFGGMGGMLQPLFGSQGQTTYFLDKNGRVINRDGQSVAWIDNNGNVYDYEGEHQGWFKGGHIRGRDGGVMVYRPGAQGLGVIPPIPRIPPLPPIPEIEPIRPIPSIPPIEPIPQLGWSDYGLE